eukprot:3829158-Rhodomonas_salina.1
MGSRTSCSVTGRSARIGVVCPDSGMCLRRNQWRFPLVSAQFVPGPRVIAFDVAAVCPQANAISEADLAEVP